MALAGWVMTGFFALFMVAASALPKFLKAKAAINSVTELGWPPTYLLVLGFIEVSLTLLFVIPRTSFFGAILLTALFGGAMASHLRVGNPLINHTLFSAYLGVFMWLSLGLRDEGLHSYLLSLF